MKTVTLKILICFAVATGAIIITAIDGVTSNQSDRQYGGFFMTSSDHEKLIVRGKPSYDGAEPF